MDAPNMTMKCIACTSLRYVALLGIPTFRDNGCPLTCTFSHETMYALNPTKQASYNSRAHLADGPDGALVLLRERDRLQGLVLI